jgi:hypothetical protein
VVIHIVLFSFPFLFLKFFFFSSISNCLSSYSVFTLAFENLFLFSSSLFVVLVKRTKYSGADKGGKGHNINSQWEDNVYPSIRSPNRPHVHLPNSWTYLDESHYCVPAADVIGRVSLRSIWHSEDRASWYILTIKPTRWTNFSNLFLE